jgi:UDP-glucose 4-epimerase
VRIGVTGASGFLGGHLVQHLATRGDFQVVALTRTLRDPFHATPEVELVQGDLSSAADCARFANGLDAIFHLAHVNVPLTSNRDLPADVTANLVPTLTLLQAIRAQDRPIRLVYASSGGALYRPTPDRTSLTEASPLEPSSSYGIVKATSEEYLRMASSEGWLTATSLRIGNAYGSVLPRERLQGFIGVAISAVAERRPVRLFGDPDNVRDFVHLRDVSNAFELALEAPEPWAVYNIGSGTGTSVRQLVDIFRSLVEWEVLVQEDAGERDEATHLPSWAVLDCSRARAEIGWNPQISLEEGIRELWTTVSS